MAEYNAIKVTKKYRPKKCALCGKEFNLNSGIQKYCSECGIIKTKERHRKAARKFCIKHKEQRRKYQIQWRKENKEHEKEYTRQWYQENKERINKKRRYWYQENKEKMNEHRRQYSKHKRKTDIKYNLNRKISNAIRRSLRGDKKGRKWEILVGYTLNDLIKHLKKTMPKSYTWKDFLRGNLQIDHIIPISVFNFSNPKHIDFKRCWALKNLKLLPSEENLAKGNNLDRPFQPSLNI